MKKLVVGFLATLGALALVVVLVWAGVKVVSVTAKGRVPARTILEVDLEKGMVEYVPEEPLAKLMYSDVSTVRDVVEALERASLDSRVVGLVARVGVGSPGLAEVQEIRDAVRAFRRKGKTAVVWAETFGEFGPGNAAYYLATAFDEIYLQPSGDLGLTGVMYEVPFIRGTLDKLNVTPRMDHRYEYKNAMNLFTDKKLDPAYREAMEKIASSQFDQLVQGIVEARKLSEDEVRGLVDRAPFLGKEAVDAKLVDGLAYRDQVYAKVKERAGKGAELLYFSRYLERAGRPHEKGETIALIYGVGSVQRGESEFDPLFRQFSMGSDTVTAAFRAAVLDKKVRAILFRVDSPGGSYVASDAIWRETVRARDAGKPVIVSMGNVAGSGGYFVAMSADKIVAQPGTITASIGVLGGKLLTSGFWDKLGLSWDEVHSGRNATMWTGTKDYTPEEWGRFQQWLDRIYEDFTGKVAEGRRLPKERVLQIARGRIWTGEDAKELGLVDELGGFDVALRITREAAGLPADAKIRLKVFPAKKSWFEALLAGGPESSEEKVTMAALERFLRVAQPLARAAQFLGMSPKEEALAMPDLEPAP